MSLKFWHMQVHPNSTGRIPPDRAIKIVKKYSAIGMGDAWEDKNGNPVHDPDWFKNEVNIGDIVCIRSGKTPLLLVEIIGDCEDKRFFEDEDFWFDIIRKVKILSDAPQKYIEKYANNPFPLAVGTLRPASEHSFTHFWYKELIAESQMETLKQLVKNSCNLILTGAPGTGKTYLARQIAEMMVLGRIHDDKHPLTEEDNVKLSKQIGFCQFHPSYDYTDFVEGLRPTPPPASGENCNIGFALKDGTFKSFCRKAITASLDKGQDNFDSSWQRLVDTLNEKIFLRIENLSGKGEFEIELNEYGTGLASRTYASEEEKASHNWTDGRSKFFSKDQLYNVYRGLPGVPNGGHDNYRKAVIKTMAKDFGLLEYRAGIENADKKQNYVFIIDEINRGDIAKIFGELFFAIDPGYRGEKGRIKTQYDNLIPDGDLFKKGFFVPENVYIIGTMNDIDRNVESMDFAIRRRFTWKEIEPEETISMWDNEKTGIPEKCKGQTLTVMTAINNAIKDEKSGLGTQYQLGAAYFMKLRDYEGNFQKLWDWHIAPLLHEYLRGTPEADKRFIDLKAVWDKSLSTQPNAEETEPPAQEQDNPSA